MIKIDYARDSLFDEQGYVMLTAKGLYKKEHEKSPQETLARAANCYSFGDKEFAQRIYDYASKKWFGYASPVISNAVEIDWPEFTKEQFEEACQWLVKNVEPDGLPISCFKSEIPDTKFGLVEASTEQRWMSMMGGGVGIIPGMRSPDDKSTGVMAHIAVSDKDTRAYKQTQKRRGSMSTNLRIDHPEIMNFITMRDPTGGDPNNKCFNINSCVCITDDFMVKMINGEDYELVDPKHGLTGRYLKARTVWEELMQQRFKTGEPYLFFIDTANERKPDWITNPEYEIHGTNLCSEVTLFTNEVRSAVCCLSSVNLELYDEWKDTNMVKDLIRFLDNVLEYFIRLAPPELKRAIYSAQQERSLGLGSMGWHSYLQKKRIPFESGGFNSAIQHTNIIFGDIKRKAVEASKELAKERGEAPDCKGSGMRNANLLAIAPNGNSADILGTSPSREPRKNNAFIADGRAGAFLKKNKYLEQDLEWYGLNTEEVWESIRNNDGSVQHLDIPDEVKALYKTAREIDPMWIIEHAAEAQKHVCQSISTNLFVWKDITLDQMSDVHTMAWFKKLKSLYYCRAQGADTIRLGTGGDEPLNSMVVKREINFETCLSCEG